MFGFSSFFGSVPLTGNKDLDAAIESIDVVGARFAEPATDTARTFSDDFSGFESFAGFGDSAFDC